MIVPSHTHPQRKQLRYRAFRRQLEETEGLYTVDKLQHHCWREHDRIVSENLSPTLSFFGCLDCGRTHWCSKPDHRTCPRAPGTSPGEYVCPFSSITLGMDFSRLSIFGSFKIQGEMSNILREDRLRTRHDDTFLSGPAVGKKVARKLAARRLWTQSDAARDGVASRSLMRNYQQMSRAYATTPAASPVAPANELGDYVSEFGPDLDMDMDVDMDNTAPGEEDESGQVTVDGRSNWESQCVAIPQAEIQEDIAFMANYLAPVAARLNAEHNNWAAPFTWPAAPFATAVAGPAKGKQTRDTWPLLTRRCTVADYLPHQQEMLQYVQRFVAYFQQQIGPTPPALSCSEYVRLCDTLLLLSNTYCPSETDAVSIARNALDGVIRLTFIMLVHVFTSACYRREPTTQVRAFIWLPDPFLAACSARQLFASFPPELIPHGVVLASVNKTTEADKLFKIVTSVPFAAQTLYHLFHPPSG